MEVACGVMFTKDGKILMGLRPRHTEGGGFWEFPGGKRERGETIEECLHREWMEELNLSIYIEKELYQYRYKKYLCRFFIGIIVDESVLKKNIHSDIVFLEKEELKELHIFPEDIEVINRIPSTSSMTKEQKDCSNQGRRWNNGQCW